MGSLSFKKKLGFPAVNTGCRPLLDVADAEHAPSAVVWCSVSLVEFYNVLQVTYCLIRKAVLFLCEAAIP